MDSCASMDFQGARNGLRLLSETLDRLEKQHVRELQELQALKAENLALAAKNEELHRQIAPDLILGDVAETKTKAAERSDFEYLEAPCWGSQSSQDMDTSEESQSPKSVSPRSSKQPSGHLHINARLRAQPSRLLMDEEICEGERTPEIPTPPVVLVRSDGSQPGEQTPERGDHSNPSLSPQVGTEAMLLEACDKLSESVELAPMWKQRGRQLGRIGKLVSSYMNFNKGQQFEPVTSFGSQVSGVDNRAVQQHCNKCRVSLKTFRKCIQGFVQKPSSSRRLVWDSFGMAFIGWDLFTIPLQVFDPPSHIAVTTMSWAATCYWTMDIPSTFLVGFHQKGVLEMRLKHIAAHYAKTWLIFDLGVVGVDWATTVLTHMMDASADRSGSVGYMRMGRFGRFLRTLRLLRLLKLQGMLSDLFELIQSEAVHIVSRIISLIIFIIMVNHFLACGFYAIGTLDFGFKETWVSYNKLDDEGVLYRYFTALHWSMTQFTPASMEVVPKNVVERIYTVVTLLFAMVTFSSFVGSITNAMTRLRNLNSDELARSGELRRYLKQNKISTDLSNNIWCWLQHAKDGNSYRAHRSQVSILKMLPKRLDTQLHNQIYLPSLTGHPFFATFYEVHTHAMWKLYRCFDEVSLDLAQELFTVGERAEMMYFCISGYMKYIAHFEERKISTHTDMSSEYGSVSTSLSALCGEGFETTEGNNVRKGQWVSEPVLWIQWQHCGHLVAQVHCEMFAIKAVAFQELMQHDLVDAWQPARYAKLYARFITENNIKINDIWADLSAFQDLAIRAFSPSYSNCTTPNSHSESSTPPSTRGSSPEPRASRQSNKRLSNASQSTARLSQASTTYSRSSRHSSPRHGSPRRSSNVSSGTPRVSAQKSDISIGALVRQDHQTTLVTI